MKRFLLAAVLTAACCLAEEAKEAKSAEHHAEEEGDPRLGLKWGNFVILAAILGYGISKSLPPYFKSRSEEITKGIAEATKLKADAESRARQIEERFAQLDAEIAAIRTKARQEMQVEADRIKRETESFLAKIHEGGMAEIEAASKRAQAELKAQAAEQALDLAEHRIRAGIQNGGGLVERFISDLAQKQAATRGSQN